MVIIWPSVAGVRTLCRQIATLNSHWPPQADFIAGTRRECRQAVDRSEAAGLIVDAEESPSQRRFMPAQLRTRSAVPFDLSIGSSPHASYRGLSKDAGDDVPVPL